MRWAIILLLVLALVPAFDGPDRLPLRAPGGRVFARGYVPQGGWPARIGVLRPVGGVMLSARDPAFGGFSALAVQHGVATLLDDSGNYVRIAIAGRRLTTLAAGALPAGPGTGGTRETRDTESLVLDPAGDRAWIGFENDNAIWRYSADLRRAQAQRQPRVMRGWPRNGGPESMVRMGRRFVVLSEVQRAAGLPGTREGIIFYGDPTAAATPAARFALRMPRGYSPSDATVLPDGNLLVLVRRWQRYHFSALLLQVPAAAIRPGAVIVPRVVAALAPPVLGENPEGLAITREGGATMLWIVTDNDNWWLRPTLLLKFRLE